MSQIIQEDILFDAYQSWLMHPITKAFVDGLKNHRERFLNNLKTASLTDDDNDRQIRRLAIGVADMDTFAQMITDYETFKNLTTRK